MYVCVLIFLIPGTVAALSESSSPKNTISCKITDRKVQLGYQSSPRGHWI